MSQTRLLSEVEELSLRVAQAGYIVRTGMEQGPGDVVARFAAIYEPGSVVPRGTWRLLASGRLLTLAEEHGAPVTDEDLARRTLPMMIAWLEASLDRPGVDVGDERRWLGAGDLGLEA
jgi:hypothetical protein